MRAAQSQRKSAFGLQTTAARGLTGGEIVNDGSKLARVKVEGQANGLPFTVERSVRRQVSPSWLFRTESIHPHNVVALWRSAAIQVQ